MHKKFSLLRLVSETVCGDAPSGRTAELLMTRAGHQLCVARGDASHHSYPPTIRNVLQTKANPPPTGPPPSRQLQGETLLLQRLRMVC